MDDLLGGSFSRAVVRSCRCTHSSKSEGSLRSSSIEEQRSNTFFPNVADNIEADGLLVRRHKDEEDKRLVSVLNEVSGADAHIWKEVMKNIHVDADKLPKKIGEADGWIVTPISLLQNLNQVRPTKLWGVYTKLKIFNMTGY
ncbi:hypothetical protein Tco_0604307 [Tanacetum coccineum]